MKRFGCGLKKFYLILHLKFHLTGNLEAITGQCVALTRTNALLLSIECGYRTCTAGLAMG
jgi:hypothetical protein